MQAEPGALIALVADPPACPEQPLTASPCCQPVFLDAVSHVSPLSLPHCELFRGQEQGAVAWWEAWGEDGQDAWVP